MHATELRLRRFRAPFLVLGSGAEGRSQPAHLYDAILATPPKGWHWRRNGGSGRMVRLVGDRSAWTAALHL